WFWANTPARPRIGGMGSTGGAEDAIRRSTERTARWSTPPMNLINRMSIGAKIWLLAAVIFGLAIVATAAGGLLSFKVERVGLEAVHQAMMEGHRSKLLSVVQAQTADLGKAFETMGSEQEKLDAMRRRFANSWFKITLEEDEPTGYFFSYDLDGVNVAHGAMPDKHGKPHWNEQDPNGTYTYCEFAAAAKAGGGFV